MTSNCIIVSTLGNLEPQMANEVKDNEINLW